MKVNKIKLGQYCREWRENNHISLQSMAIKSNTIYTHISRFERGENASLKLVLVYMSLGMEIDNPSDFLIEGKDDE